ncbi:hypothetical protein [Rhodohalobacter sp.]|uniref:hypothetical protein n=1 Tax=Rhodohalobacter sp. TaxID=1974210 RepID=UPI002ACE2F6A|nr:hypothetical protein [Rhodohalobacter sp.]MDZ7758250.1 hypothetical protein [Rhodohalobacter sp.]
MTDVGQIERNTQNRVVKLFRDRLKYDYLGDWQYREGTSNVEEAQLRPFLEKQGYIPNIIDRDLNELTRKVGVQTETATIPAIKNILIMQSQPLLFLINVSSK